MDYQNAQNVRNAKQMKYADSAEVEMSTGNGVHRHAKQQMKFVYRSQKKHERIDTEMRIL